MRATALTAARVLALAGPTALAFFAGGYFDGPRAWAGALAWLGVLIAAVAGARLPRGRPAAVTIGGLALLGAWTLLSILWAPLAGNAYHAGQIVVLYLGALVGAAMLFGDRPGRLVDPVLAAGTLVVIGYGLSERLLPGLLHFSRSLSAQGRLEEPLTYWNTMGEVAAIGLVLCARVAGDAARRPWLRGLAAAAAGPLGMGLYVSFSRGALFACAAGLVALIIAAARREQLRAAGICVMAGLLAAVAAAPFGGVTSLQGALGTRERQGAIGLVLLVLIGVAAALGQLLLIGREQPGALKLPRRAPVFAVAVICAGLALAIAVGAHERSTVSQPLSGGATRLVTLQSNRYAYWDVALRAFAREPVHGVGAGGWSVYWLRWRTVAEFAQDAHSLPLQVLAELGIVGLALLAVFLVGLALAAARALRQGPVAAGPVAGLVAYFAHAPLDWDWQMPAVTLIAMVLAGTLLARTAPPGSGPGRTPVAADAD
ncbi:MAG: hypothetical protein QOF83_3950 [Solirubrobacteraceae bacterium]|nr:hypothetical protein [Solirubrobacteraceae bacterium]